LHYATDYRRTLEEARRCLRWASRVVVLDTPLYEHYAHGERIREERKRDCERRYGFRSDSVPSMEYLDHGMLRELSKDLNMRWRVYRPFYGWRRRFDNLRALVRRGQRPPHYWILVGTWTKT
jgi:hypothetical protein